MSTVAFESLRSADLAVDAVYQGGSAGTIADDPLARLLPVGNQGGFRYRGSPPSPLLVALLTTGKHPAWPDALDPHTGVFTYFGDNRHPGRQLHDTDRRGNTILARSFEQAHQDAYARELAPVFLLFQATGVRRDIRFLGLAVPGSRSVAGGEDLVAVWRTVAGRRFQNYRATFTILDIPSVNRMWINSVVSGHKSSCEAPLPYARWVESGDYTPLMAPKVGETRSRQEQVPSAGQDQEVVDAVYQVCKDSPVLFEQVAADLWQAVAGGRTELRLTRPTQDGGRDAVGDFFLGPVSDQISLEFSLEAKCYSPGHGVGVRDVARLVSRIRHREFGVFVTTSYIGDQAYREVREDGHPVVFLVAQDIADILKSQGITTGGEATAWAQAIAARPASPYASVTRRMR